MIFTLELKQFRGLEHVKFENLGRANLIIGGNNTGKTSVLEALTVLYGDQDQLKNLPKTFREQPKESEDSGAGFWRSLAKDEDPLHLLIRVNDGYVEGDTIEAVASNETLQFVRSKEETSTLSSRPVVIVQNGPGNDFGINRVLGKVRLSILATRQQDPGDVSELFNQIAPLNPENETKLEELLCKAIEPRLRRLRYARPQGTNPHLVYADLGKGPMLPFTQLGQAFARTLEVYCKIFANQPKIILIDEIENGLYYEGMEDFWKGLMAVLEDQDVQLFATTHSRECMEAAQKAASAMGGDPLRFLRLDRRIDDPGKIVATTFGKEEMQTAIEFNREMR